MRPRHLDGKKVLLEENTSKTEVINSLTAKGNELESRISQMQEDAQTEAFTKIQHKISNK
jgi:hypothetical protein